MSDSKQTKLLTIKIQPSNELNALIAGHRDELAQTRAAIELSQRIAERNHPRNITGGLLAAMAVSAANDALEPERLELGQWVFEGQDEEWVSAAWDGDGGVWLFKRPSKELKCSARDGYFFWYTDDAVANKFVCYLKPYSEMKLDSITQKLRLIDRETINDVDYLSEARSEIQGMEASDIIIDEMGRDYSHNSNCLHAVVPQITQADMQHIFIKNLSDVLIQRMHSMGRFSEDDYHIGNDKLMLWDIVKTNEVDEEFGVVVAKAEYEFKKENRSRASIVGFRKFCNGYHNTAHTLSYSLMPTAQLICTITEAELPAFRAALEACYV